MIRDEWRSWVEDGPGVMVGSMNADGTPEITRCVGVTVETPTSLRLVFGRDSAEPLLRNLEQGRRLTAVSIVRMSDFKALQFKGTAEAVGIDDADVRENARYRERFLVNCRTIFAPVPSKGFERARTVPEVCVRLVVTEIYDQTPGPHSGLAVTEPA